MTARLLTEAEIAATLDIGTAIRAIEEGLRQQGRGDAHVMEKTHVAWDGATLHAVGGVLADEGLAGTKTWAHTPGGAAPYLLLFDAADGSLRALIEAFALGQLRTAAVCGVATAALADPGADELAVVGAGEQALTQVAAVAAVRPVRRVRVFSRDERKATDFCAHIADRLGIAAGACGSVADTVRDAPIITLATRATSPFLAPGLPPPGAHINAIGAITPERIEFEPALLQRCSVVVADSIDQASRLSAEFRAFYGPDPRAWSRVERLADLVLGDRPRPQGADLTLFKALGVGLFDLVLGAYCLRHAEISGLGTALPAAPARADVRLRDRG
ncbi:ornithine cyclodeaminase family protein [Actinomadura sp. WMMB 499]|uniref:ornithine cyclodeaminase family protein n=1 Tax=Actinomadura sp. WMMB 499 TaxID=1219491 RepID=UPI00159E2A0B|nr:ornithine cyclodeaminase family protein [Actinomadura sp. WMMB 499]